MDSKLISKIVLAKKFISMNFTMILFTSPVQHLQLKGLKTKLVWDKTWAIVIYNFVD